MLLVISADVFEAMDRIGDMQTNIRDFGHSDIREGLIDWQVEDMHRQYPNVDSDQEFVSWFTLIWPRSRTYDQTHRTQGRAVRRSSRRSRGPRLATVPRLVRGTSKRPILRPALFNELVLRMTDLMGERLTWSRTGPNKPPSGPPTLSSLGAQSARRASMLGAPGAATATPAPAPSAASIGPKTRARLANLSKGTPATPAPAPTPESLGPKTRARLAKLAKPPATPAPARSPASLGPQTRARLMKLGLLKPNE